MASNEVRVKNEPIYDHESISETRVTNSSQNQPNRTQSNNKHLIKHEKQSISINDSKRTRESIPNDDQPNNEQPNKLRRQSIKSNKVKEEPKDFEIQTSKSQVEVKAEEEEKFSAREEFITNKISIAFLNEEIPSNSQSNKPQKKNTAKSK